MGIQDVYYKYEDPEESQVADYRVEERDREGLGLLGEREVATGNGRHVRSSQDCLATQEKSPVKIPDWAKFYNPISSSLERFFCS